jgi:hypothetical protein
VEDLEEMIEVEVEMEGLEKCFPQCVTIVVTTAKCPLDQVAKSQCIAATVSIKQATEVVSAKVETSIDHNVVFEIKARDMIGHEMTDQVLMPPVTIAASTARFLLNQRKTSQFFVMNVLKTIKTLDEDMRAMRSKLALKT